MTAKEYLSRYRKLMKDIVFNEAMKEQAIENIASLKSPSLDERVKSSPRSDPIGEMVITLERDISKFNLEIVNCQIKMNLIDNQLYQLRDYDEDYYKLLSYKYVMGLSWEEIANKMITSKSSVTHVHGPALLKFDEMFGDTYRDL